MMKAHRKTIALGITMVFLVLAGTAVACGSMGAGLGKTRGQALTSVLTTLFLPMIVLVPVELGILNLVGGLREKMWSTYAACLVAKGISVVAVSFAVVYGMSGGIIAVELFYSFMHFMISYSILVRVSTNAIPTAAFISTIIPWLYSAGIPVTYGLMAYIYR